MKTNSQSVKKEPRIRIAKRVEMSSKYKILLTAFSVLAALIISGILILFLGKNPFEFFLQVIVGSFGSAINLKLLIRIFVPILITSLGLSIAFKMRFWNIGGEGQFIIGALVAMTFALLIGDSLGRFGVFVVIVTGAVGGGLFALIPALFKVKFNTNETLFTLMLNYIALYLVQYFLYGGPKFYISDRPGIPTFKVIDEMLFLSDFKSGLFSVDTSIIVAAILIVFIFVYLKYTKHGYEISVVGDSVNTAVYSGMNVKLITLRTIFFSGAIVGLAGALQLTGSAAGHTLSVNITGGVGWTAIIVAWLAKLNPLGISIVSLLMSVLEKGCGYARTKMGISDAVSDIIQGLILFTVLACDFFINYKVILKKTDKKNMLFDSASAKNELTSNKDESEGSNDLKLCEGGENK